MISDRLVSLRSARLAAVALVLTLTLSACATSGGGAGGWAGRRAEGARRETPRPAPAPPLVIRVPAHRPEAAPAPAPSSSILLMPVVGFDPSRLQDSFTSPRSGGRTHNSIDMPAPRGTPLVAVTDGTVTRTTWNALGGRTLYLRSADGQTDYYYAHMDSYAPGITEHVVVRRGDALGTVGSTGNARGPHLHFQVLSVSGSGRGTPVNPYGLFRAAEMAVAR
ncbi:MAG TPA: M23 family metallopeptidase [Rubricoccaceae bacterium]|jgi:murein DD-endopeptidase MepM/ murein hydrolase activator NlpD